MFSEKIIKFKNNIPGKMNLLDLFILLLIFIFFITLLWNDRIAKICYTLLALISLYLIASRKLNYNLTKLEKLFLWSIALSFFWVVISYFINGMPEKGGSWILNRQLRLFLIIPIYLMLRSRPIPHNTWWYAIGLGAIVAGATAFLQIYILHSSPSGRATGDTNAIFFGQVSLCLSFIAIIGAKKFYNENKIVSLLLLVSVCLGFIAINLSGARTAWLAMPFMLSITVWYLVYNVIHKKILIFLALFIMLISMFQFSTVQERIYMTVDNLQEYLDSDNIEDPVHETGIGIRLDIWKSMINTIFQNPVFGIGIGGFKDELQGQINKGHVNPGRNIVPHSHNQYVEISLYSGLVGLVFNIGIFIFPLANFIKHLKYDHTDVDLLSLSGIIIVISFIIYGISDLTITRKIPIMFYGLTISIVFSLMYQITRKKQTQSLVDN